MSIEQRSDSTPDEDTSAFPDNHGAAENAQDEKPTQTDPSTVSEQHTDATEPEKPKSLLDLVENVVKDEEEGDEGEEGSSPEKKAEESEAGADKGEQPKEAKDEDLPFHKHPRFQQVIAEKNAYKADAEQFRAISGYMRENGLEPAEVNQLFEFGALLKNDPRKALEALTPIYENLRFVTGQAMPDDVAQMIEDGDISEAAAKELAQARADRELAERRRLAEAERIQRQAAEQGQHAIANAVTEWEGRIAATDPDYEAKKGLTLKLIRLAHMEKPARTPQEAIAIAEAAYKEASETLKGAIPRKKEIKQPTAAQSATHATRTPKSLADVVDMAIQGR